MLARLMPREIHADVNAGYSLIECLREMEERRARWGTEGCFWQDRLASISGLGYLDLPASPYTKFDYSSLFIDQFV